MRSHERTKLAYVTSRLFQKVWLPRVEYRSTIKEDLWPLARVSALK